MTEDIIDLIRENVIQGRVTSDDEGLEEGLVGQPGVVELVKEALKSGVDVSDIIDKGLSASMAIVGKKFEEKEYCVRPCVITRGRV